MDRQLIELLLLSFLIGYVRHSSRLHTLLCLLLVEVLERVFIEVDRLRSLGRWCRLLIHDLVRYRSQLCVQSFEACADFLGR